MPIQPQTTEWTWEADTRTLRVYGPNVDTFLATYKDLYSVQHLDLSRTDVSDNSMSVLSQLTSLETLDMGVTNVADISKLSGLKSLKTLNLYGTNVSDISEISCLVSLETLDLSRTNVADISKLSGLMSLENLSLSWTKVTDISALSGLKSLEWLSLSDTKVSDISKLSGLESLVTLNLSRTNVADISKLSGLESLETLHLTGTNVADISKLSGLMSLESLYLSFTKVTDIFALSDLNSLKSLHLQKTCVKDISPLSNRKLEVLNLIDTPVTDFSALHDVQILSLTDPGLAKETELILTGNQKIYKYTEESSEHLAACKDAEMSQKSTRTDKKPEEAILMPTGQGDTTHVDKKPISGAAIALICVSVALVVGGGLCFLYFKQAAVV